MCYKAIKLTSTKLILGRIKARHYAICQVIRSQIDKVLRQQHQLKVSVFFFWLWHLLSILECLYFPFRLCVRLYHCVCGINCVDIINIYKYIRITEYMFPRKKSYFQEMLVILVKLGIKSIQITDGNGIIAAEKSRGDIQQDTHKWVTALKVLLTTASIVATFFIDLFL